MPQTAVSHFNGRGLTAVKSEPLLVQLHAQLELDHSDWPETCSLRHVSVIAIHTQSYFTAGGLPPNTSPVEAQIWFFLGLVFISEPLWHGSEIFS
jgi:hypothetical protein